MFNTRPSPSEIPVITVTTDRASKSVHSSRRATSNLRSARRWAAEAPALAGVLGVGVSYAALASFTRVAWVAPTVRRAARETTPAPAGIAAVLRGILFAPSYINIRHVAMK